MPLILLAGHAKGADSERPYEMVWANRTQDARPALIDFENLDGWSVEARDATATMTLSREQQLWGQYVARIAYRGTAPQARFILRPPKPIPVPAPFDCVDFWVYGNNWGWEKSSGTPRIAIHLLLQTAAGKDLRVTLCGSMNWKEWFLIHKKFSPSDEAAVKDGARVTGIEITNATNTDERKIYLDNLSVYQETLAPLTFDPRPRRGVEPFAGQSPGLNTGKDRLPFPTREETLLPDNLDREYKSQVIQNGETFIFRYRGSDGTLEYRYRPKTGDWSDWEAQWMNGGGAFQPLAQGGARFIEEKISGQPPAPLQRQLIECKLIGDILTASWRVSQGVRSAQVDYTFRIWQKSLILDTRCLGGEIGQVDFGSAIGAENPRLVKLPYLVGEGSNRPAVLAMGAPDKPLFLMGIADHTRTNASRFWFRNEVGEKGVSYNGGTRYEPKTDGRRNDCFERFFLTISPAFPEVLPNIPNPKSPWMEAAGERVWIANGASVREKDLQAWKDVARRSMTKILVTDHETGWRDGGESFTFRTKAAPKKGGDEGQAWYSSEMHKLGFRYGIYNNYTDFATVNEFWSPDMVTRLSDGNWRTAWARCYNPKPARAVEYEARLTPIIQEKFHLSTAYCDVHTAVSPWAYVDYDARVPGAGTMAATFYAYGEIMLHQKKTWNGPVYSEGNNHWYYSGLTDGNYAQDQEYNLYENPWLVDFDLRKMHPLNNNFGMGNLDMFMGRSGGFSGTPEEKSRKLDRFIAATLAFGHTGFLVREMGMPGTARSYFMTQQPGEYLAGAKVERFHYYNEKGEAFSTGSAVATGAYKRSQLLIYYSNDVCVAVNGHKTEPLRFGIRNNEDITLPPNGYLVFAPCNEPFNPPYLWAISYERDGRRVDYIDSRAYIYADGRGAFTRFRKAACDGPFAAIRQKDERTMELIPFSGCKEFAVGFESTSPFSDYPGVTARALGEKREDMGPAETRSSRGLVYVTPKPGAVSYLVTSGNRSIPNTWNVREKLIPGERLEFMTPDGPSSVSVPLTAKIGSRLWQKCGQYWLDFTVVPLARIETRVIEDSQNLSQALELTLTSNLPKPADMTVEALSQTKTFANLAPGTPAAWRLAPETPQKEGVIEVSIQCRAQGLSLAEKRWLKYSFESRRVASLSDGERPAEILRSGGQCKRGGREEALDSDTGASVSPHPSPCGGKTQPGLFMHPPYQHGVGYAFAQFGPLMLPAQYPAALRCEVGKADGSDPGDGIWFRVAVVDSSGSQTLAAEKHLIRHEWAPLEADLSRWKGQTIRIKLIADAGPKDNTSGDWSCWTWPAIESLRPIMSLTIHEQRTPSDPIP
ncbi:MAG: hypothetical protein NTX50_17300 [Candidatus Sumerlaeota bacterium]|nr:hypothetical protein [Candidatus Sumerlaeota bacterium]